MSVSPPQILHIDADAFAASVERALDPSLAGRPVIVGDDAGGRGLVACASYEARRMGVRQGMPLNAARRRLPDAAYLPRNPAEYERFSLRLFELLRAQAPVAEASSLDDFYLDLTGCERLRGGDLVRWAVGLARAVRGEVGVPVSLGIAANKMVARVATCLAKPGRILRVCHGCEREFLAPSCLALSG